MRCLVPLVVLLAACDPPPASLFLALSNGPAQLCPAACTDIPLDCDMFVSIRILDPAHPSAPYRTQCERVAPNAKADLCSLNRIQLETGSLPYEDLEIQVALYPADQIVLNDLQQPVCPADATYDNTDGFPVGAPGSPAVGGRGYYRAGDDQIVVTLGCSNLAALSNEMCTGVGTLQARGTVVDFDTQFSVSSADADHVTVSIGEPRVEDPNFVLNPTDLTQLDKVESGAPAWAGAVDGSFVSTACLTVLDDTPQSVLTARCIQDATEARRDYDITGVRLTKSSLDRILSALSLTTFPAAGLTIGVVLENGVPVGGQAVTAPGATIEYLSSDRSAVVGSSTSGGPTGGVFVSRDAPYGTTFSSMKGITVDSDIGGLITGKVTIVVLDVGQTVQPGT